MPIRRQVPEANVSGNVGRRTSFEVTVNDKLIFSKLKAGAFPDNKEVVEMVKRASKGETVEKVKKKKETCVAM
ncbi:hypothetical protein AGOR_G00002790 [Albula goreensis]|uniref:Uncharacterized protein n=1 Tax=Albula goreensis TaxID=1534307 RepID=A0A8T3E8V2_9TELE|nr:hypothetical protein AGOR_G00002790 [Albula goreensis]